MERWRKQTQDREKSPEEEKKLHKIFQDNQSRMANSGFFLCLPSGSDNVNGDAKWQPFESLAAVVAVVVAAAAATD